MEKRINAQHGILCRLPGERFGYFGWPSVARMDDGTLVAASSGLRSQHVCPWGKTVVHFSADDGKTWSASKVINDSPLDDRDAGVVNLGERKLLVTWFTSDTRKYVESCKSWLGEEEVASWSEALASWTDEIVKRWLGSWILLSEDGGQTWSQPVRVPVSTPHGPIVLSDGRLLYLGKDAREMNNGEILCAESEDGGRAWTVLGSVPVCEGTQNQNYHEPHLAELASGKLVGMIRVESLAQESPAEGLINFSLFQTESEDGGRTWTAAKPTGVYGSPPHLLRHSSGALVCVYGYRKPPYGQRAMISRDEGITWDSGWVIRDDGPDSDLGYPASAELPNGDLFTLYYQKYAAGERCSLLWSRWELPQ